MGGTCSYGTAVSNNGIVAGCSDVASGGVHAFIYRDGAMQDLGTGTDSPAGNSCALAVDSSGAAAGRAASGELVIWNGKSLTRLGVQGNVGGMNNGGVVVGSYTQAGQGRAFVYKNGALTDLGAGAANAVNTRGQVAGTLDGHAFLSDTGTLTDLGTLGGNTSAARGINDRGDVVGVSSNEFGQPTPFIHDGAMRELPGGSYAAAIDVNDRLQVVASAEGRHGYLAVDGVVTPLDSLPAVRARGWRNLEPTGINDQGWIVGTGVDPDGNFRAFLLVPRDLPDNLFTRTRKP
jgi:probable HAF family extracellular repeat protein